MLFCRKLGHRYCIYYENSGSIPVSDIEYGPWLEGIDHTASLLLGKIEDSYQCVPTMALFMPLYLYDESTGIAMETRRCPQSSMVMGDTTIIPYADGRLPSTPKKRHAESGVTKRLEEDGNLALNKLKTLVMVAVMQPH